jgi:hypothetical protein
MARKQQAQERRDAEKAARQEVKLSLKVAGLAFDYAQVDEAYRATVQQAAVTIRARMRRTVEDMIEIGRQLNEVKALLPERQFERWMATEFEMSRRSAFEFRSIADRFAAQSAIIALISPTIVRRLAAPSVPDEAVRQVIAAARASDKPLRVQDAMAIVKPYMPVKPPRPKQLPPPPEPDGDVISAEYTVQPRHEFIFPGHALTPDKIAPVIGRELGRKLQDALVHRIFKELLTRDEYDELMIALTRALEE